MANHKSSVKRAKQDLKKRAANRSKETAVKSVVKTIRSAILSKDKSKANELLTMVQAMMAKLAKTGVFTKQTASRRTSRLSSQVAKM